MVSWFNLIFLTLLLAALINCEEDEHEHVGHWEWAGVYQVSDYQLGHNLIIEKGGEIDANFTIEVLVVATSSGDEEGLEEAEEEAEHIGENNNETSVSGNYVDISVDTVYEVGMGDESWVTTLNIQFPSNGYYTLFLEHGMDELCAGDCFRDSLGEHMDPLFVEEGHEDEESDKTNAEWGLTMAGCFVVWCAVFVGVLLLMGGFESYNSLSDKNLFLINRFAAGALLSTAFCLIGLESSHFMESSKRSEADIAGLWGAMILSGFLTGTLIDMCREFMLIFMANESKNVNEYASATPNDNGDNAIVIPETSQELGLEAGTALEMVAKKTGDSDVTQDAYTLKKPEVSRNADGVLVSIIVGDFLHNLCDGVFIGAAFQSCSATLGWTIVAATAWHELAQEIADFIVLTKTAKLDIKTALLANAASGFSVVLGGIIVSAAELSNLWVGILLAFGAGNYIYLGASELFSSVHSDSAIKRSVSLKVMGLAMFAAGACAVGLVLLNHEHCDGEGSAHEGHDH